MSDERQQEQPDDSEPTPERQAELRAAYEANVAADKAPYAGVALRTRGELTWVLQERRWSGEFEPGEEIWFPRGFERADLSGANLKDTNLSGAHLTRANLTRAHLTRANLTRAHLTNANLTRAHLTNANLTRAELSGANLSEAYLTNANLSEAGLANVNLSEARLFDANLSEARLFDANLSGASLRGASLSGASLVRADLRRTDLRGGRMDATTGLLSASLDSRTRLADVVWNGVPLTRLNWQDVRLLGDEQIAQQPKDKQGKHKDKATRLQEYADAVLANRQVATVLRSQGVNEHADRFAYRAQLCQRVVARRQRQYLRYLGSLFLGLISGYSYRPLRSVFTYVLVVLAFAGAYLLNAQFAAPHLRWDEALVLSISAFHGRGFFTSGISLGDTLARLAAAEAILGLLIEITFIATFTNRFFAR